MIGKGVCPLLISNMYWIQLVALQSFASLPHSSDKALTLLDGAWTSLQALYMAEKVQSHYFRAKLKIKNATVMIPDLPTELQD